jgi:hypothetical protein
MDVQTPLETEYNKENDPFQKASLILTTYVLGLVSKHFTHCKLNILWVKLFNKTI